MLYAKMMAVISVSTAYLVMPEAINPARRVEANSQI
jgi:hypothetical protein